MRRIVVGLCGAALAACARPTDLTRPPGATDVTIEFCVGQGPTWLAYRNEGSGWSAIPASVFKSSYHFTATPKVQIAYVRAVSLASLSQTFVLNLTADEVQHVRCLTGAAGSKRLSGMVKTINAHDDVRVLMGSAVSFMFPGMTSYAFFVREGPLDLFAMIRPFPTPSDAGEPLIIVQHGIDLGDGAALPLLDFTSADAKPFSTSRVTVQGLIGNAVATGRVNYLSALGTDVAIGALLSQNGVLTVSSVPEILLGAGDVHRVALTTTSATAARDIVFYQRAARDTTVVFGPLLSAHTVDAVTVTPTLRPRARFGAQANYPSLARATFAQSDQFAFRSVTIHTTAAYTGGVPTTWELEVPDLSAAPGFQETWALRAGSVAVTVQAWNARTALYFGGGTATAGETMLAAAATSSVALSK